MKNYTFVDGIGQVVRFIATTDFAEVPEPQYGETRIEGVTARPGLDRWDGDRVLPIGTGPISVRVLKDTIVQRMKAAGLLGNLAAMVASLPPEDRFEFDQSSWFSSSNPRIRAGIAACGGDPDAILAFDPLA